MESSEQISRNLKDPNYTYNKNGHKIFAKNNQIGRMKKKGYTILDLTNTAIAYDKTHDETILQHYINQIIKDNQLLKDFINKYVPTTTKNELTGADGSPLIKTTVLEKEIYYACPLRLQCPIEKKVCEAERLEAIEKAEKKDEKG